MGLTPIGIAAPVRAAILVLVLSILLSIRARSEPATG